MEFTLVAVVVLLWLAATGRLMNAWGVLTGAPPSPQTKTQSGASQTNVNGNLINQTPLQIQTNTGWAPLDGRVFDPNPNSTFSDMRGQPVRTVPTEVRVENYR